MKFIRKALLPGVIAAGFLGFLGAVGGNVPTVSAAPGDICSITGPSFIAQGETVKYTAIVEDGYELGLDIDVDLNDLSGDSDITRVNTGASINTNFINDQALLNAGNVCADSDDEIWEATYDANYALIHNWLLEAIDRGENCAGPADVQPTFCDLNAFPGHNFIPNDFGGNLLSWQDNDIDCGLTAINGGTCEIPGYVTALAAASLAKDITNGVDVGVTANCVAVGERMENAILGGWQGGTNGTSNYIAAQFEDYVVNDEECDIPGSAAPGADDGIITIEVTCRSAGAFDLSFAVDDNEDSESVHVVCGGPVYSANITARPLTVEIVPSLNNVSHSLVTVELWDRNDKPAVPGTNVLFTVDRCSVETGGVNSEDEYLAAAGVFAAYNPLVSTSGIAVETHASTTASVDSASRQADETTSFTIRAGQTVPETGADRERTVAAAIIGCNPVDAPGVTPGALKVTALVDRASPLDDIVLSQEITVVGPPAANGVTVTAAPASLACGEKATISVDVKDAAGQPVSDHTWVEVVTNHGGVLAGTGAVAGQAGLVSPVSSTVAETFGGKATIYLLTSTAHVGKYEVVITTGGGGGVTGQNPGIPMTNLLGGLFSTAPISVQVTVECTVPTVAAPQPGPSTSGPQTGQGIRPPSTGDAGLASTESNSWALGAVAAVAAALAVAGLSVKLVREE